MTMQILPTTSTIPMPAETAPQQKWRRRKHARPEEISKAALTIFAQKGYAAATMADIAALAGITKGTIYLYFRNKEDLFNALVREHIADKLAEKFNSLEDDGDDVVRAITHCFDVVTEMVLTDEALALGRIITAEARNFPELAQFWRTEVIDRLLSRITTLMQRGAEAGVITAVQPEAAALLCLAPALQSLIWRSTFDFAERECPDPRSLMGQQRAIILQGLQGGGRA
ncbi:AcrR family transcriptional regulator [Rhizomicrobium palustre]|uniref:AcrR family transcriptional regulator n=1 Tax=Rhizomicrobium palustre TaxID=189966 RepID=A0A846MV56_9PROT|nr:TetR/AcrR family transcriptional regulator [Rhizomicrobium palustre]NIK87105.1 AcrR family transcriptional regulator [Rhizomicrobium palustre]